MAKTECSGCGKPISSAEPSIAGRRTFPGSAFVQEGELPPPPPPWSTSRSVGRSCRSSSCVRVAEGDRAVPSPPRAAEKVPAVLARDLRELQSRGLRRAAQLGVDGRRSGAEEQVVRDQRRADLGLDPWLARPRFPVTLCSGKHCSGCRSHARSTGAADGSVVDRGDRVSCAYGVPPSARTRVPS